MPQIKSIYDAEMPNIVPGTYGNASIEYEEESDFYTLYYKGIRWMNTDRSFAHAKDTLHSQYDQAYGDVLITGLGFGILTKALSEKDEVSSVTVLEIEPDIIDAFLASNSLNEKVTIIQADASTYTSDSKYDCLLPDHYELQNFSWKLRDMNSLASRISHDLFWPWSIEEMFLVENYPRQTYVDEAKTELLYTEETVFTDHLSEIPSKWDEFISTNFPLSPGLLDIDGDKLVEYLKKNAKHYYMGY